ncbi:MULTISPECIES: hypothetical protein [Pseudofrankia]|uniref:hypothetical protein n=1 Tax=Pseudofrankia TaxID=2994363 RepID=UPI000234C768|nr:MULTISPECIES: hypothetical protein [Pseudofrankia]OHV41497.1 hypothetical protein BCD49_00600 [Pseudofrankia sp. EUN1h]
MPENTPTPPRITPAQALHEHLDRAALGQGVGYPQPDGETKFACDMEDSPYGCPWCDHFEWPDGNPLDVA